VSPSDVLKLIDPVDPDSLQQFRPGVWSARWAPPVLGGDIEALKRTPGIRIIRPEYEPPGLRKWVGIDFVIE
jgi:hypothetical protein